ncbi:MAG TPA: polysaccharide biosynthesis C-terminal domain-containing protein, partial [Clostridia bacterium]|nr:polysaccharide biosynthesis C-terminal domain-containing protein [Clostridia bacterium]
ALALLAVIEGILPTTLFSGLTTVLIPTLSCLTKQDASRRIETAFEAGVLISAFFAMLLFLTGKDLGHMLYGEEKAGIYLRFIAPFSAIIGLHLIGSASLNGLGLQNKALVNQCVGNVVMLILTYILPRMPEFRMFGYLIALGTNFILTGVLHMIACVRHTGMKLSYMRLIVLPLFCVAVSALITIFMTNLLSMTYGLTALLLQSAMAGAAFIILAYSADLFTPFLEYLPKRQARKAG